MKNYKNRVGSWQSTLTPYSSQDNIKSLKIFIELLQTSRGPGGKLKLLHNNVGGHVSMTSSSNRLLSLLSIKQPLNKLLSVAIQSHVQCYSDAGLFMGIIASQLVVISHSNVVKANILSKIHNFLSKQCFTYLESNHCQCKFVLEMGELQVLRNIGHSFLKSKPGCILSECKRNFLTDLIVELFLHTFKNKINKNIYSRFGVVNYLSFYGMDPLNSAIHKGILIETLRLNHVNLIHTDLKAVCYASSLSGDNELFDNIDCETRNSSTVCDAIIQEMLKKCQILCRNEVKLVLCQKVIHPKIKYFLKNRNILVFDRLGLKHIMTFKEMTGNL